jgi:hypothetical protein
MAYDIYGEILKKGYCEVHPWIDEEYPCSLCYEEDAAPDRLKKENAILREQMTQPAQAVPVPVHTNEPIANPAHTDEEYLNDLAQRLHNYPSRVMNTPATQKIYDAIQQGMYVIADEIIKSLGKL